MQIYGLIRDYYGFKNITKIVIFRYGESFDIHLGYGGTEIFWDERVQMLDTRNIDKRRYKFRQQIYKSIETYPLPPPPKRKLTIEDQILKTKQMLNRLVRKVELEEKYGKENTETFLEQN